MRTKNKSSMIYELVKAIISGITALVLLVYGFSGDYSASVSVIEYFLFKSQIIEYFIVNLDLSVGSHIEPQMLWCHLRMIAFFMCSIICVISVVSYKVYEAAENNRELLDKKTNEQ